MLWAGDTRAEAGNRGTRDWRDRECPGGAVSARQEGSFLQEEAVEGIWGALEPPGKEKGWVQVSDFESGAREPTEAWGVGQRLLWTSSACWGPGGGGRGRARYRWGLWCRWSAPPSPPDALWSLRYWPARSAGQSRRSCQIQADATQPPSSSDPQRTAVLHQNHTWTDLHHHRTGRRLVHRSPCGQLCWVSSGSGGEKKRYQLSSIRCDGLSLWAMPHPGFCVGEEPCSDTELVPGEQRSCWGLEGRGWRGWPAQRQGFGPAHCAGRRETT